MTLEELQARVLELTEENQNLKTERDTLSQNNETLTKDVEELRTINQKYFNKLIAQESSEPNKGSNGDDDVTVPTCEEFAKTLKII